MARIITVACFVNVLLLTPIVDCLETRPQDIAKEAARMAKHLLVHGERELEADEPMEDAIGDQ